MVFVVEGIVCSCWGRRNTLKHGQDEWMDCGRIEDMSNEIMVMIIYVRIQVAGLGHEEYNIPRVWCDSVLRHRFQSTERPVAVSLISQPNTLSGRVFSALTILLRYHQTRRFCRTFDRGSIAS